MVSLLKKLISPHSASSPLVLLTDCISRLWPSHIGTGCGLWRYCIRLGQRGAETGSGKTLAYLAPLIDDILQRRRPRRTIRYDYARAVILVPNKELVQQVVRMAMHCRVGTGVVWWQVASIPCWCRKVAATKLPCR
jgi:hypothetical protein